MKTHSVEEVSSNDTDHLQHLIQLNIDSTKGFEEASEQLKDPQLKKLFHEIGAERARNTTELQRHVVYSGETPVESGSYLGAFHRAWIDLRSLISSGDSHSILAEAERGEDAIKGAYETALEQVEPSLRSVVQEQYTGVKAAHDRVKALRDSFAA